MAWLEAKAAYTKNKPKDNTLKGYLIRHTIWKMRDWLIAQTRVVKEYPYYYFSKEQSRFVLDLSFLIKGTKIFPFSKLNPYERYLIFLRFREERTIVEIAYIIQKHRCNISKDLYHTIDKLRRLFDET